MSATGLLLKELRLPTMFEQYESTSQYAEQGGWTYNQYLHQLCELELNERMGRRKKRLLQEACLPEGKYLETLDQQLLPTKVRKQLANLLDGSFIDKTENVLAFGLPGRGKTHLCCAIARELILKQDRRVYFTSAFHLVQKLLLAKRDFKIEDKLRRLDYYQLVIIDDIGYVQQSREEMEVLFTFLAERYERRSLMITSNLVFSEWDKIFKDPMTTAAAIDRLVHHSIILELDGESFRAKHAKSRKEKSE